MGFFSRRRATQGRTAQKDGTEEEPSKPKNGIATLRRVLRYVVPYSKWMALAIVALIGTVSLALVLPLVIRSLVDVVFVDASPDNLTLLNRLIGGLFIVFIVQAIVSFVHRLSLAYVGERVIVDIRVAIYSHLQKLSLSYFADHRTGEIVSRLTNDVSLLQNVVTNNIVMLLRQSLQLLGASALLFYLNWKLTLVILVGIPLMSLTIVYLGGRIRKAAKVVQDKLAETANVIEETTSGVRIVKSFAREEYEIGRYTDSVNDIYRAAMERAKISAVLAPIIGLLAFGSIAATMWFGSYQVINGDLSAGGLVAYLIYTMMVATPVSTLAGLYSQFQSALGATERLFELLDTVPDIADAPDAVELPLIIGQVVFDGVDFRYNDRVGILEDVAFAMDEHNADADSLAQAGQVIALVGPSGAGKTTLVNLIPRFYDVNAGAITIDGYDVRNVTIKSLRDQIGIVPQETTLFSDTVANNIRYGKLDATQAEIEAAALAANAHDFIVSDLPDGYQTLVGERGVKLSGGQRQRVAIARAILKNPRILILDEATSSLDSESERLVQDALDRLMAGRTSFVIAHRFSTIVNADHILVMEQGRVVEQGTHSELLLNPDGLYTRLHTMQFESALN